MNKLNELKKKVNKTKSDEVSTNPQATSTPVANANAGQKQNSQNNDSSNSNELLEKIENLKIEADDWKYKALRAAADQQNALKQNEFNIQSASKRSKKQVSEQVISFLNTLFLAFSFTPKTEDEAVIKFVNALKGSFEKLIRDLELVDVKIIVPEIGQAFDPEFMSALNSSNDEELKVKQIVSLGLKIDGQLVHSCNVMV